MDLIYLDHNKCSGRMLLLDCLTLDDEKIGCPNTLVTNYQCTLHNIQEE